ncbi:transcription cofactor HES-6-like isoform X1 [Tyto alba]|uniref:transcription cofactor HES-6-like isoform X1 n=1 Tax=Tyto alba TaxID=56313 RepID=UPI001C671F9C|nr:transcription cofactor HES-6-like isoform X1 [Tyto alba]
MAPSFRPGKGRPPRGDGDCAEPGADRKTRKPLVEKKRRARINESLQELRLLLADSEFQAKLENAEVLELTVRRVQAVLERRALGEWRRGGGGPARAAPHPAPPLSVSRGAEGGRLHREASERFAAGYIQCMHEVHTFVSSCPGIDATTAAELLNHLLESMPLNEGGFPDLVADVLADPALGPWPGGQALAPAAAASPGLAPPASAPSPCPSDETCSDSEEAEAEPGQTPTDGLDASRRRSLPSPGSPKSMWRPW